MYSRARKTTPRQEYQTREPKQNIRLGWPALAANLLREMASESELFRGEHQMIVTYDIFRKLPAGDPVWVEAVQGLEIAKSRLEELVNVRPGDYYLYDLGCERIIAIASAS